MRKPAQEIEISLIGECGLWRRTSSLFFFLRCETPILLYRDQSTGQQRCLPARGAEQSPDWEGNNTSSQKNKHVHRVPTASGHSSAQHPAWGQRPVSDTQTN